MRKLFQISLVIIVPAFLTSCSIKEVRGPCPCWLQVDVSSCNGSDKLLVSAWNPDKVFATKINVSDYPDCYEKSVPKGEIAVSAIRGMKASSLTGHDLLVKSGNEADSIWAFASYVLALDESLRVKTALHKQFATVHLSIAKDASGGFPYKLRVNSNIAGFDVRDLSPVSGEFICSPQELAAGNFVFRLFRQKDDSFTVGLIKGGVSIGDLPVGEYVAKAGYDWSAEDLEDIYIGIDYIQSKATVSVEDWDEAVSFPIKI